MCRNITTLRGLEPPATQDEIEAAARQFVRKVSGVTSTSSRTDQAVEKAVFAVAAATAELLGGLPPRKQPPGVLPPLRRRPAQVRAVGAAAPFLRRKGPVRPSTRPTTSPKTTKT